jgi:hypothetical protein
VRDRVSHPYETTGKIIVLYNPSLLQNIITIQTSFHLNATPVI